MTYHRVDSCFWSDEKVVTWTDDMKLLSLYIKTGPHASMEGFYRLPKPYICADLGWSGKRLAEPFRQLLESGFIKYDETVSVVLVMNALKYQSPQNPNQATAAVEQVIRLPKTPLLRDFQLLAERYSERLSLLLAERFGQYQLQLPTNSLPPPTIEEEEPPDPQVAECIRLAQKIKGWKATPDDSEYFVNLLEAHDLPMIKKVIEDLRVFQINPKKQYKNLQSTLRNWCGLEKERRDGRKTDGSTGRGESQRPGDYRAPSLRG